MTSSPTMVADEEQTHAPPSPSNKRGKVKRILIRYAMVWVLIALVIAAQISYSRFLTFTNVKNLLSQNAEVGIIAAGMTLVLIGGGFDLSVTGTLSLGSVLFAGFCMNNGISVVPALLLVLAVGAGCGLLNGLVVTKLGVNPFVTTLGTAAVFDGIAALYSNSEPITVSGVPGFAALGSNSILGLPIAYLVAHRHLPGGYLRAREEHLWSEVVRDRWERSRCAFGRYSGRPGAHCDVRCMRRRSDPRWGAAGFDFGSWAG